MSSALTAQQAADFSGAAYDALENGSIVDGYMLVSQKHNTSTGFTAQVWASVTDPSQVVFAFAGTNSVNDLADDIQLAGGTDPAQFTEALQFYNNYLAENPQVSSAYVTGHSLGGALAEYIAANGSTPIAGGFTFEAPGIAQLPGVNPTSTGPLVNYFEANDPVANFAGVDNAVGTDEHIGSTSIVGTQDQDFVDYQSQYDEWMTSGVASETIEQIAAIVSAGGPLLDYIAKYHPLGVVLQSLGLSSYNPGPTEQAYVGSDVYEILQDFAFTGFGAEAGWANNDILSPQSESDDSQLISFKDQDSYTISWSQEASFDVVGYVGNNQDISFSAKKGVAVLLGDDDSISGYGGGSDVFVGGSGQTFTDTLDLSKMGLKNSTVQSERSSENDEGLVISNGGSAVAAFNFKKIIFGNESDAISLSEVDASNLSEIDAGNGNDTITSSVDSLKIELGNGNDTITNSGDNVTIMVGSGHDTIFNSGNDVTIDLGNGENDVILSSGNNGTFVLGDGNDTVDSAGAGSVIEAGSGNDTFVLSNDVEITGATSNDAIYYFGQKLTGALAWNTAQGGWAVSNTTGVSYGINKQGALVVKSPTGQTLYIANYVGGPGAAYDTADIFVGVASETAYPISAKHPSVNLIMSQVAIANAEYKVATGKSLWPGMDPLVLDLTGNGLDLIGESDQSPVYDAYGDGFAVHTGWVKPDDGFLVQDVNGTYQLFGSPGTSGFQALAALDTDGDGVINASDAAFSSLYVWQDLNGNGVIDPGELTSLSALNITSINVASTPQAGDVVNGNSVTATGTFTYANGTTGSIGDVTFLTDNFNTQYTGNSSISAAAALEPDLKGYGTLDDLQVAMTNDPTQDLLATVEADMPNLDVVDLGALRNAAMPILSAWAEAVPLSDTALAPGGHSDLTVLVTSDQGVDTITDYAYEVTGTDASGNSVTYWALASGNSVLDANGNVIQYPSLQDVLAQTSSDGTWTTMTGAELDFAERYLGDPIAVTGNLSDPSQSLSVLGPELTAAWNAVNLETVRLAMQGPLAPYFAGLSYSASSDTFDVTTNEQLAPMFTAIFSAATGDDAADATAWINSWAPILNIIEGNLAPSQDLTADYGYLFASMVAGYEAAQAQALTQGQTPIPLDIKAVAEALGIPGDLIYDSGATLQAAAEDANIFYAASGNQTINGSGGPDTDVFGSNFGNDVVNNQNTNQDSDILWFATLDPADITASRSGVNLILTNNKTGAQINVLNEWIGVQPTLFGGNLNPNTGVDQIVFADGTVWNLPDITYNAGLNTEGVDGTLLGTNASDVLDGANATFMSGGNGGDIYLFDRGDGADTILASDYDFLVTSPNIVSFGPGLTPSDVTFTRIGDSDNLTIVINGDSADSLTVLGQFDYTYTGVFGTQNFDEIQGFQFYDGTEYSAAQVQQMVLQAEEAIPYNTIYGFGGNDVIDPGVGGNDWMSGGNGDDIYIFGMGYGHDTVYAGNDNFIAGDDSTILFNADITPQDVTFVRQGDSNDLEILVNNDPNDSLVVQDQFDYVYTGVFGTLNPNQIDWFRFADGTVYAADQLEQMVIQSAEQIPDNTIYGFGENDVFDPGVGGNDWMSGGNGNDTYIFGLGYGHDTIYDGSDNLESPRNDTVVFGPGVNPGDVTVDRNGGSMDVTLLLSDGSSLTILDQFDYINGSGFGIWTFNTIFNFQFQDANNTAWSYYDLENEAIAQQIATPGAAIYGFWTSNTMDPGTTGNHLMVAQGGTDTYVFGLGYGHDTIDDDGRGEILFNADVNPADVKFIRNDAADPNDLTILLSDGSELDVEGQFNYAPYGFGDIWTNDVQSFQFQDSNNTQITDAQLEQILLTQAEQIPNSTIEGFFGGGVLDGAAGNETLLGVNGYSTFLFGLGYGAEVIGLEDDGYYWDQRAAGVVQFGAGILPSDVTLVTEAQTGELLVEIAGASDTLSIENYQGMLSAGRISFSFANGTSWSSAQIVNIIETNVLDKELGTQGSTLYGPFPDNYVDPGVDGNHDMVGSGSDTYVFGLGYGNDTIDDSSDGGSELLFNADVDPSAVTFSRGGANDFDLTITLADGSVLDIQNEFGYTPFGFGDNVNYDVGTFQFQDAAATSLSYEQVANEVLQQEEATPDSTIYGYFGGSTLNGASGNDTFVGMNGANTVLFGYGDGAEYLSLYDDGWYYDIRATANIIFGAGITSQSISVVPNGSTGSLTVLLNGTKDSLTIADYSSLLSDGFLSFQFADGTIWSSSTIMTYLEAQTLNAELATPGNSLVGPFPNNYVDPGHGGGRLINDEGYTSTYAFGYGYGDDIIQDSSSGRSELLFAPGITPSMVEFTRGGANFFDLTITLADGSMLDIQNELGYHAYGFGDIINYDVGTFQFQDANQTTITYNQLFAQILAQEEATQYSTVYGQLGGGIFSGVGDNTFVGMNGANTIQYGRSDGDDYVSLYDDGWYYAQRPSATIDFEGITDDQVTVYADGGSGNVAVQVTGTNDIIWIYGGQALASAQRLSFQFSDGIVWSGATIADDWISNSLPTITLTASEMETTLVGVNDSENVFVAAPGGDRITFGQSDAGVSGPQNIVDYDAGDGAVTINANGSAGALVMGGGITASDLYFQSDAAGDLTIGLLGADGEPTGDSIVTRDALSVYSAAYSWHFGSSIAVMQFADGSSLAISGGLTDTWWGAAGNTTLTGSEFAANQFENLANGDTIIFGDGDEGMSSTQNIIDYNDGDGAVSIDLNGSGGTIVMGAGVTQSDVIFQSDAAGDLTISLLGNGGTLTGDSMTIGGDLYLWDYNSYELSHVADLEFSDGSSLAITGVLTDTWIASTSDTTLVGSNWAANLFELAPGGDSVTFGHGNGVSSAQNVVDYGIGDGAATINLNGAGGTIVMGPGVTEGDLIFHSDAAGDLTISLLGSGGTLTGDSMTIAGDLYLWDYNSYELSHVADLEFSDGSSLAITGALTDTWIASASDTTLVGSNWAANLFELAPGGDSVTFGHGNGVSSAQNIVDYGRGDGPATISLNGAGGTIVMGAGIAKSDVIFQSDAGGDLTISLLGNGGTLTGDSVTIAGDLYLWDYNSYELSHVADVEFDDGSSIAITGAVTDTWIASATDTTLVGSNWAANLFKLAPGGDSVTFGRGNGVSSTQNIVDYGTGDGAATINLNGVGGTIVMGVGITENDVYFQSGTSDLTIGLLGTNGMPSSDYIVVDDGSISALLFSNGDTLAMTGSPRDTWFASATNTTLVGGGSAINQFVLAPGGDSVTFGLQNIVDYNVGDGEVTIDPNGRTGTIVLGAGVTASDVYFQSDAAGDLTIGLLGADGEPTGDTIVTGGALSIYAANYSWHFGSSITELEFVDGSSLGINGSLMDTWWGAAGHTTLTGSTFSANQFESLASGDTIIFGQGDEGMSSAQNIVDYDIGDGAVSINANGSSGTIVLGAGITASDVYFQSDAAGDLTVGLLGAGGTPTGGSIVADGALSIYYAGYNWHFGSSITELEFGDGSSLGINGSLTDTWWGAAGATTLTGSTFSANLFESLASGDEIVFGRGNNGQSSTQNIVDYDAGDGAVSINANGSSGTIVLGAGITASDVYFQSDAAGDLTVGLLGAGGTPTGDSIVTDGALSIYSANYSWHFGSSITELEFTDGSSLGINGSLTDTWWGAAGDTTLTGSTFSANQFESLASGDEIVFGRGNNGQSSTQNIVDYDAGDGAVSINANGSSGAIVMGAGITASDVYFQSDSAGDLTIGLLGADGELTGDSIVTDGALSIYSAGYSWHFGSSITELEFADGSALAISGSLTDTWWGAAGDTTLTGSTFSANLFESLASGDEIVFGRGNNGQSSTQNIVDYDAGDGAVSINANGSSGAIVMGAGITASDVYFQSDAAGDLTIGLLGADGEPTGDTIVTDGALSIYYASYSMHFSSSITELEFADGSALAISGSLMDTWWGEAGNTTLTGSTFSANLFESLASGDEIVFGRGNSGESSTQNIVDYDIGDGAVSVDPNGVGQSSQLDFGKGASASQLWFSRDGNDLTINVIDSQDEVDIQNWFSTSGDQLSEIATGASYLTNSAVNQLVAAMATFETNNPGFNPELATQMPSDPSLQAALAASWHSAA